MTSPARPAAPARRTEARRHVPLRQSCARPHACPAPVRMQVLSQVPLFAGLPTAKLIEIDRRMVSLAWNEDDPLYHAGDPAEHLYVVAAGRAKAVRPTGDGREIVVDFLAPGDLVGGLRTLGRPVHTETVRALTTTCALRIDAGAFRDVLVEHPAVALRALDDVADQLAGARSALTEQSTATVAQRVAAAILRLAEKFGQERAEGGLLIQLPLSRADLAGMTGSTPESVSRVMSRLRAEGVLDSGRRWTTVLDRARLAAEAA